MNNIIKKLAYLLVISAIFSSNSCIKLDEEVYDKLAGGTVFQTQEDVLPIAGKTYSVLRSLYTWHGWWMLQEYCTDEICQPTRGWGAWQDGGVWIAMHKHTFDAETGIESSFYYLNEGISTTNRVIDMLELSDIEFEGLDQIIAECKMVRALYYFLLTDSYGNVPFVTGYSQLPEGFLPEQKSREEVVAWLIDEISQNMELLSDEAPRNEYYGRFTQWGAKALLAELYLNSEIYKGVARWDECIAMCDEIINSGYFSLDSDFRGPFSPDNENNPEAIFSIPFDEDYATGLYFYRLTMHYASQATYNAVTGAWNGFCAIPSMFDSFDPDDIRRDATWISGPQTDAAGNPIYYDGQQVDFSNTVGSIEFVDMDDGVRLGKWQYYDGIKSGMNNDIHFFRLGKVYLMKAECLLRKGDADGAVQVLNELRERAFNPDKPIAAADLTLDHMLNEWAWETNCEGNRRRDQVRFNAFTTASWPPDHVPNGDHRNIFAIPQWAMEANQNLVQNPGY